MPDIQGYRHHQIPEMMEWSVGTSKGQLHRARARLPELLQDSQQYLGLFSRAAGQCHYCEPLYGMDDCAGAFCVAGGNFERIRDSTCFQTLGSHSISVCDLAKARSYHGYSSHLIGLV